jgi:hypothetical protein
LRRAIAWATLLAGGADERATFSACVVHFAAVEGQEELRQLYRAVWTEKTAAPASAAANPFTSPDA